MPELGFESIEVIIPRTKGDLELLRDLDKQGLLAHGGSYPELLGEREGTKQESTGSENRT